MVMTQWPIPRLTLTATVDPAEREKVTFSVTGSKLPGTATLDPGDGHRTLPVTIGPDGSGTAVYEYPDAGHHVWTATVTAACPQLAGEWSTFSDLTGKWSEIPGLIATWADGFRTTETATATVTVDVGAATITAYVTDGTDVPLVAVDVFIGLSTTPKVTGWTVTRVSDDAATDTVIWIDRTHPSGTSIEDREVPLRVPVAYRLDITTDDGKPLSFLSNTVVMDRINGCVLTAVDTGRSMPVTVQSWDEATRDARAVRLAIVGRADPVVVSDVHVWDKGAIVFRTLTRLELLALRALLDAPVLLLRTQPASALESMYFTPGNVAEARLFPADGSSWVRQHQVEYQHVAAPLASARINGTTWTMLTAAYATWADVPPRFPTWTDVRSWRGGAL